VEQVVLQVEAQDRNIQVVMELQVQTTIQVEVVEDGLEVVVVEMTQVEPMVVEVVVDPRM
jgi:hypothetical protein